MTNEKNVSLETGNSTHFLPERLIFIVKIMLTLKDNFCKCHSDTTLMKMLISPWKFIQIQATGTELNT